MKAFRPAQREDRTMTSNTIETTVPVAVGRAASPAPGAKVIVFPEAFIVGYPKGLGYGLVIGARDAAGREEFRIYLEAAIEVPGPQTQRLRGAAAADARYGGTGVVEREIGPR